MVMRHPNSSSQLQSLVESVLQELVFETVYYLGEEGDEQNQDPDKATYPSGFDVKRLKSISSFAGKVKYAAAHLSKLGQGSSRIAFAVDANTVIKIARNNKGLAQNQTESDATNIGAGEAIAQVKEVDDDYFWIEMERASKMTKPLFKQLTGFVFEDFGRSLQYWYFTEKSTLKYYAGTGPVLQNQIKETQLFQSITEMVVNFDMPIGDFMKTSSWGVVNRNGKQMPVLIDYGITEDILKTHYRR